MIQRQQKNGSNTEEALFQPSTKKVVPLDSLEIYTKIIEDLSKETLNYQEIIERCKTFQVDYSFAMKNLILCAKGLDLIDLANELQKAATCLDVLFAYRSSSINLSEVLSDFGEEDFVYLIQKASKNENEELIRALQYTQLIVRGNRVSHYRRAFASGKEAAYDYLDSLSIMTLVSLADDLEASLGNALYGANGAHTPEYTLVVSKINESVQKANQENSNVEYSPFFSKKMSRYSAVAG